MNYRLSRIFSRRGSILVHVLVTGIIMAIITSSLMQMLMLQYRVTARAQQSSFAKREAEMALARIMSNWAETNVCRTISTSPTLTCSPNQTNPATAVCACVCQGTNIPKVTAAIVGGACTIKIEASPAF